MNRPPYEPLDPQERELADRLARIAPRGEPSAQLDAGILAAARAAVEPAMPIARPRSRWPLGLGIAASTVLALGIAWQLRPVDTQPQASEQPQAEVSAAPEIADDNQDAGMASAAPAPAPMVSTAPVAAPKAAPPVPRQSAPLPEKPAAPVAAAVEAPLEVSEPRPSDLYAPPPPPQVMSAPPPPPPPAPPAFVAEPPPLADAAPTDAVLARETAERQAPREATQQADATAAAKAARARAEQDATASDIAAYGTRALSAPPSWTEVEADARLSIEHWLQQIALRQRLGDIDGARRSLSLFRQAHPQHPIPDDLKPLLDE